LVAAACSDAAAITETLPEPEPEPGYPPATSRLTLRLGGEFQKLCHATLIDRRWAITAAHCFSRVDPEGRGALNELARSLSVSDVRFHPSALRSGVTTLESVASEEDFVAAHDLAMIPVDPPIDTVMAPVRWLPEPGCSLPTPLGVRAWFGQLGFGDRAQTAEATLLGMVSAASLLGPGHPGSLLSAQGSAVRPGDSGSGVLADWGEISELATGCARDENAAESEILVGVIQDANPDRPTLPFGLIPLHVFDHASWIATIIESAEAPDIPERPQLDP
jgi:Trypsin